jgi:hypothetical protein
MSIKPTLKPVEEEQWKNLLLNKTFQNKSW